MQSKHAILHDISLDIFSLEKYRKSVIRDLKCKHTGPGYAEKENNRGQNGTNIHPRRDSSQASKRIYVCIGSNHIKGYTKNYRKVSDFPHAIRQLQMELLGVFRNGRERKGGRCSVSY